MKTFWNWDIHYACNYRCSYCFLAGKWDAAAGANRYLGTKKWVEAWSRIYDRYGACHIHLSGGEPSTYPDFFELLAYLNEKFTLQVSTNLTFNVADFIKRFNPERIKLDASFHPEFADFSKFSTDILSLKENNFTVSVSLVAYPAHLEMVKGLNDHFSGNGVRFIVQPFRGEYRGRKYPLEYSEADKELLRRCGEDILSSKDMVAYHLNEKQKDKKLCHMGQAYGKIYASADVHRCCSTGAKKIGNLLNDADFALLDNPEICEVQDCICWRRMVVGEESKWSPHWR